MWKRESHLCEGLSHCPNEYPHIDSVLVNETGFKALCPESLVDSIDFANVTKDTLNGGVKETGGISVKEGEVA